jgi:hypothetical protein
VTRDVREHIRKATTDDPIWVIVRRGSAGIAGGDPNIHDLSTVKYKGVKLPRRTAPKHSPRFQKSLPGSDEMKARVMRDYSNYLLERICALI